LDEADLDWIGSGPNTIGVVLVAAFAANDAGASKVTSTATLRINSSSARPWALPKVGT
jgi:hypothetical protein